MDTTNIIRSTAALLASLGALVTPQCALAGSTATSDETASQHEAAARVTTSNRVRSPLMAWSSIHGGIREFTRTRRLGAQLTTWYGPGFFGNRTACGQRLREGTWGVAHRTLPCGSLVHIGFKGRSVVVPVIDRGPYGSASVDLTQRTATQLRFTRHGRANVVATLVKRKR